MSLLYIVVLVAIAAALLAVAVSRTLKVKTKADYLVAGRSLPAVVLSPLHCKESKQTMSPPPDSY